MGALCDMNRVTDYYITGLPVGVSGGAETGFGARIDINDRQLTNWMVTLHHQCRRPIYIIIVIYQVRPESKRA